MKKTGKILLLVLCAVLLVVGSVAGTLAYLTSQDSVENTFTVGKVAITMDEAKVDAYGNPVAGADRVKTNEYKLIPGRTYTKDPTIHVDSASETCWLFVKIENGNSNATLAGQTGWTQITGTDYWAYKDIVAPGANVVVFNSFTYEETVSDTTNDSATKINVTAYAIQSDGFATSDAAWTALKGQLNLG